MNQKISNSKNDSHSRFYRTAPSRELNKYQSVYDFIFVSNKDNMDWPAVKYLSHTWTFRELKIHVDKLADAFVNTGLCQGDTVLVGLSNCVEAVLCLLAINKVGAVSKWIDIRATAEDIKKYLVATECKFFVAVENIVSVINQLDDSYGVKSLITVSPFEMMSLPYRIGYAVKAAAISELRQPVSNKFFSISFRDFIMTGNSNNEFVQPFFSECRPAFIVQSSGTTGKPKNIVHSNLSATSCAWSLSHSDLPIEPHTRMLVMLPPWIAYSLGQTMIYPLSVGACIILDPFYMHQDAILRHLDETFDTCCGVPHHYRYLRDHFSKLTPEEKSKIYSAKAYITGGDKLSPDENEDFDRTFHTPVVNGYGNNECWGCISVNCTAHNVYGSVGIPIFGETVISYDNDNECELPANTVGEICVLSDSQFLCYADNPKQTSEVKKQHKDGKIWLHTGDLGLITEEGFIFLRGRIRRIITRRSYKMSAYTIEDTVTSLPMVKECVAVEVKDKEDGGVPMIFVVLDDVFSISDQNSIENIIQSKCQSSLKDYEIPKYIIFKNSLPYTSNKKYDFSLLESEGNAYVDSLNLPDNNERSISD